MAIAVSTNTANSEVTISMDKNFDFNCVDEFRSSYEGITSDNVVNFIIDMRRTHYMDSSALGMLINMHKYWSDKGSKIRIINSSDQIRKIFTISRFDKKFQID